MSKQAQVFGGNSSSRDVHHYEQLARQLRADAFHDAFAAVGRGAVALVREIRRWQRKRAAIRELESLSDHILKDIGVVRGQIRTLVDAQLDEQETTSVTRISGSSAVARDEDERDWQRAA